MNKAALSPAAGHSLRIQLLGNFHVTVDDVAVEEKRWARRGAKLLVKLLALRPGHQLHRDQAMELLWPGSSPEASANNLNKLIHRARRALEPSLSTGIESRFLLREADLILLRAPGSLWIDVDAFEEQAAAAVKINTTEAYEAVLGSYTGDLLDEDLYEDWLRAKRDQLRLLYQDLMRRLAQAYEVDGRYQDCIECLNKILVSEPSNEDAHRHLMGLYAQTGHREQAIAQYRRCSEVVKAELAIAPEETTTELYENIISGRFQASVQVEPALMANVGTEVNSVAVLPFSNNTGDPNLEYFSDGITESLINGLAHLAGLRVMARSTVFRYKGDEIDPQTVGRQLAVQAVVLGRVTQLGERLIIAVELVHIPDGSLLWGDQYNRVSTDIFAVQRDISEKITEMLRLKLTSSDKERLQKHHTENTEAYHIFLRGRFYWNKRTGTDLKKALGYFEEAIEEDPTYALAYAGLADCYNLLSLYSVVPPSEAMPKARAAATQALEIDDTLAEAHTSLAHYRLTYDRDWTRAESAFQRAFELNPNYATAHQWYHKCLTAMGRFEEAAAQIDKAKDLDPLSLIINTEAAWGAYFARRYDGAMQLLAETIEMDAHFSMAHFILGLVFQQTQRFDEAISELQKAIDLQQGSPFTMAVGVLGYACARSGDTDSAHLQLTRLAELSQQQYVSVYNRAVVHAGLEEVNNALDCLEKAFDERAERLIFLNVEPMFDSLRSHARFRRLIRRLGLLRSASSIPGSAET